MGLSTLSEDKYVAYLTSERRRFAWVMHRYGGLTAAQADAAALARYPYEASDAPYRYLVFHNRAWHWAMLKIHKDRYWVTYPELVSPPTEYNALK